MEKTLLPTKTFNLTNLLLWVACWFGSIVMFVLIIMYKLGNTNTPYSPIESGTMLIIVIFGIIAFIKVILDIEIAIKRKYPRAIGSLLSALSFVVLLVLGVGIIISAMNLYSKPKKNDVQAEKTKYTLLQSPLKMGSTGEDVSLLQSILKQNNNLYPAGIVNGYYGRLTSEAVSKFQANNGLSQSGEMDEATISKFNEIYGTKPKEEYQKDITPTTYVAPNNTTTNTSNFGSNDSDPVVNCRSNECGTIKLKQSECANQYICCEVGSGNWSWYGSNDKCKQAQRDFHNQGNNSNNPPQQNQNTNLVAVYLTYGGYTVYCPPQNASAAQTIDATMNSKKDEWARSFNSCADNFRNSDSCYQACKATHTNGFMACSDTQCYDKVSSEYGTCISNCPDVNKACDSVYWERKSLSSQISSLCQ